jgi:uncharacterized membrane protein
MRVAALRAHEVVALVSLVLLILAYVIPYTLLRGSKGWELYTFWTLLSIIALIASWVGVRSWRQELS